MTTSVHEDVVSWLQDFFKVPNNGVVDDPLIMVTGQPLHYEPSGTEVEIAPDVAVRPDITIVPRPSAYTVIPHPPSDVNRNPHTRIVCEVAVNQSTGHLRQKCST
ncbi:8806_t:CDS:2 [Scutellospora calospora]|uniref:8806_t:CDS:1 n=1 Tax=Scutellospora calospora TaxID=85575 RepID=A0ACA9K344_9GLOM|nr:8806_t:CDS:2 [Scutellospora calospora]